MSNNLFSKWQYTVTAENSVKYNITLYNNIWPFLKIYDDRIIYDNTYQYTIKIINNLWEYTIYNTNELSENMRYIIK